MIEIKQEVFRKALDYDPDTGIFLWKPKIKRYKDGFRPWSSQNPAGYQHPDGYRMINFEGKGYMEHRIAWVYINGPLEFQQEIDHINGIKNDNRIANLRTATRGQNVHHTPLSRKNKSGFKGVCLHRGRWEVNIGKNGRQTYVGSASTPEEAAEIYKREAIATFGEFAMTDSAWK
jgi:hypothetical protein